MSTLSPLFLSGKPARALLDFVDLHGGIDGEIGIANGGAGGCGQMARSDSETGARTFDRVGIAVALGTGHGKRIGGDEFAQRSAFAVGGDVGAFGLGDLQEVASNAGQADGLCRSGTFIRGWHSLQRELIDGEEKGGTDEKADKSAHEKIVARPAIHFKQDAGPVALGNNVSIFAWNYGRSVRLLSTAEFPSPV